MPVEFITGNALNMALETLFEKAERHLVLISPYINLHDRYASVLKSKLQNDKLAIVLVFGKNEDDPSRSMRKADLDFFAQFPNVQIRYEPRLHAKYYASDHLAIITSMNLYRYSQDHNIEAGVLIESITIGADLANKAMGRTDMDTAAAEYFDRVIDQAELIYRKEPRYESAMLGLAKKYVGSDVTLDRVAEFFTNEKAFSKPLRTAQSAKAPAEPQKVAAAPSSQGAASSSRTGYCIRTGVPIPFNKDAPMCAEAQRSWDRFKKTDYPEKFCHFSGEPSHGETTYAKPILSKNWRKAKEIFDL